MKKDNMKLAGLLLALACTSACGVGAVVAGSSAVAPASITASAETTTYTMSKVAALAKSTASVIEAYSTVDAEKPAVSSWDHKFTFVEGSGKGFLYNGVAHTGWTMKQPGRDLYIALGKEAAVGDVVIIDGTFYSADADANLVFTLAVEWNGEKWVEYIEYTTYEIGRVCIGASTSDKAMYLNRADKNKYPVTEGTWTEKLTFEAGSGAGITLNGAQISMNDIKIPNNMYVGLGATAVEGDVVVIEGTFYNKNLAVKYVVEKTSFRYNGSTWEVADEYKTYAVSLNEPLAAGCSATAVQLKLNGEGIPAGDWNNAFTFEEGSGEGLKLNDTVLTTKDIKFPGLFYANLGTTAVAGDVLTIDGTYYNRNLSRKFVFDNAQATFDGTAWTVVAEEPEEPEVPEVVYETCELGSLKLSRVSDGSNPDHVPKANQIYASTTATVPVNSWQVKFALESGEGFKLNGNAFTPDEFITADGYVFFNVASANVQPGDVVTVSGTFVNEAEKVKYVVAETAFIWTGTLWQIYVAPTTYEIGKISIDGGSSATAVYFKKVSGEGFEATDGTWAEKLYFISGTGAGVTFNGTQLAAKDVKIPSNIYCGLEGNSAEEGATLVVGGEFYNSALAVKYVITESKFVFTNGAWTDYVETPVEPEQPEEPDVPTVEYTEVNLGRLLPKDSSDIERLYLKTDGENKFIDVEAEYIEMTYVSGTQVLVNGVASAYSRCRAYDNQFYLKIDGQKEIGTKVTFGGVFVNEDLKIKYIIEDSDFWWNGSAWQTEEYQAPTEYVVYEIGKLGVHNNSNGMLTNVPAANAIYMKRWDNQKLPIEDSTWNAKFVLESGDGWKVNGEKAEFGALVSSNSGLYINVASANVQVGDVLTVSGTFTYAGGMAKYVIEECGFVWNGTAWEEKVEYETHEVGSLIFAKWTEGSNHIYLARADGQRYAIPQDTNGGWSATFFAKDGVGVTLNGTPIKVGSMKMPNSMFINIGVAPKVGDVLTVGGTFYNTGSARLDNGTYTYFQAIQFVVTETSFTWNGSAWVVNETPEVPEEDPTKDFTAYNVTKVGANRDSKANVVYLYTVEGDTLPKDQGGWDVVCTFKAGSGAGLKLNGETLTTTDIKLPGDMYIGLGKEAAVGDVFTIDGVFYNADKQFKLVFKNCQVQWDGTSWTTYEGGETPDNPDTPDTPVAGTTNVGALVVHKHSSGATSNKPSAKNVYLTAKNGTQFPVTDWASRFTFEAGSGVGVTVNGQAVSFTMTSATKDQLYFTLENEVNAGDELMIGGTFVDANGAKYVIDECTVVWNGTAWENKVVYTTYELGDMKFTQWTADRLYFYMRRVDGQAITPPEDGNNGWTETFKWKDGAGIKINDKDVSASVKIPQEFFLALYQVPEAGDILTIGGTFYSEKYGVEYIINEVSFMWDGATWIPVVEYEDCATGALVVAESQTTADTISLVRADGGDFIVDSYDYVFTFNGASGTGIRMNGELIETRTFKTYGGQILIDLSVSAVEGDILTIGGNFYNVAIAKQYIVEESSFIYANGVWSVYENDYVQVGVGEVVVDADASSEWQVYFLSKNGVKLPVSSWDDEFVVAAGVGVTLNGEALEEAIIYSLDDAFVVELGVDAVEGDVLVIGGQFVCDTQGALYFIKQCAFTWNGEAWEKEIQYSDVDLGSVKLHGASASATSGANNTLQLKAAGSIIKTEGELVLESGVGVAVNGQAVTATFKNASEGYLNVTFDGVQEGDEVTIGGTFLWAEQEVRYVIEETTFVWTGSWAIKCEKVEVGTFLIITSTTSAQDLYLAPSDYTVQLPVPPIP